MTSHPYTPPLYGKKVKIAQQERSVPLLPLDENTKIRHVVEKFFFYARAINNKLLMGFNAIASHQDKATD